MLQFSWNPVNLKTLKDFLKECYLYSLFIPNQTKFSSVRLEIGGGVAIEITLNPINNNIFEDVQVCIGDPCTVDVPWSQDVEDILSLLIIQYFISKLN